MSMTFRKESYMQLSFGQKWKKKYVMLSSDGQLMYADGKRSKKTSVVLSEKTQIAQLPSSEVGGEHGFLINTPGKSDRVAMRSKNKAEAMEWFKLINRALQNAKDDGLGADTRKGLAKKGSVQDLISAGRSYGSQTSLQKVGSRKNLKMVLSEEEGWVMKVGKSKDSPDFFVNARTWEYHASKQDSRDGKKPLGKALLSLLV
uniref:PH domain-containing protein n=1 Tax=Aplanochytrium stocchinoi TaxID=215587 RepID=A0A6S8EN65_9STRA|mmetsp:Transcript_12679/g.14404  ORF Transcript_12679/g.14404 Transcript_12679/m.14404 type:complete len:202 (+) Transcript_12679:521-1126(+)